MPVILKMRLANLSAFLVWLSQTSSVNFLSYSSQNPFSWFKLQNSTQITLFWKAIRHWFTGPLSWSQSFKLGQILALLEYTHLIFIECLLYTQHEIIIGTKRQVFLAIKQGKFSSFQPFHMMAQLVNTVSAYIMVNPIHILRPIRSVLRNRYIFSHEKNTGTKNKTSTLLVDFFTQRSSSSCKGFAQRKKVRKIDWWSDRTISYCSTECY